MTNKLTSKLVSIILTVAICLTTVFGCLVTVSAENTASYVITGAQCVEGDILASAIVEFSVPQGIAGGRFTIDNTNGWYESVAVTPYGDITESTYVVDVTTEGGNVVFNIIDDNDDSISYPIVAFKLDFVFSSPISDDIEINISNVDLNGIYPNENYSSFANNSTNAFFTAGCQHKFVATGEVVYTSTDPEYTVYSQAICSVCGEGKSDYQVVPSIEKDEGEVVIFSGAASTAKPVELLDPSNPVNSESNPYIIELPVQLLALSRGVLKNTNDEEVSAGGYYYKVKDGIKAFVMQGVDAATANTIMSLSSADEVNAYFAGAATKTTYWGLSDSSKTFNGHFDGNGVEIYGIYSSGQATALFTQVSGTSSIKNFTLKNSYISTNSGAGVAAIVGKTPNDTNVDSVVIENIVIANNYIEQTGNQVAGANAIVGVCNSNTNSTSAAGRDFVKIYNCLVYGNELVNDAYTGTALKSGLVADCSGLLEIKNVIALGVTPWTLNAGGWYLKQIQDGTIANVYTDASQADWDAYAAYNGNNTVANATKFNINYALDVNALKGDAAATTASALNWNTDENPNGIWFTGNAGQYPTLLKGSETLVADSSDYAWKLLGVNLTYKNDGDKTTFDIEYMRVYQADGRRDIVTPDTENFNNGNHFGY